MSLLTANLKVTTTLRLALIGNKKELAPTAIVQLPTALRMPFLSVAGMCGSGLSNPNDVHS